MSSSELEAGILRRKDIWRNPAPFWILLFHRFLSVAAFTLILYPHTVFAQVSYSTYTLQTLALVFQDLASLLCPRFIFLTALGQYQRIFFQLKIIRTKLVCTLMNQIFFLNSILMQWDKDSFIHSNSFKHKHRRILDWSHFSPSFPNQYSFLGIWPVQSQWVPHLEEKHGVCFNALLSPS